MVDALYDESLSKIDRENEINYSCVSRLSVAVSAHRCGEDSKVV